MNNLEKITKQKEKILELITLMSDKNTPEVIRETYHDRCLVILESYQGKDFSELINKYLKAEWRR